MKNQLSDWDCWSGIVISSPLVATLVTVPAPHPPAGIFSPFRQGEGRKLPPLLVALNLSVTSPLSPFTGRGGGKPPLG